MDTQKKYDINNKLAILSKKRKISKDGKKAINELYEKYRRYIDSIVRKCYYMFKDRGSYISIDDVYDEAIEIFIQSIKHYKRKYDSKYSVSNFDGYIIKNLDYLFKKVLRKHNKYNRNILFSDCKSDELDNIIPNKFCDFINENLIDVKLIFGDGGILQKNKVISDRDRHILIRRYLYNDSYREIGEMYNITRARVEQIDKKAMKKVKKYLKARLLFVRRQTPRVDNRINHSV